VKRLQWLVFFVAAIAVVSRRPDVVLHPQFYGEDGVVWYAQAYNLGWLHALSLPEGGYLNTLPRLAAALALLVPFHAAPLAMNLLGIVVQVLPVNVLLSPRCAAYGTLPVRLLAAAIYLALPNSNEVFVVITNAQFHLALVACLLGFASPPATWLGRIFDMGVFLVSGLTGPFCLVLLPLVAAFWWIRRSCWLITIMSVLAFAAIVQLNELLHTGDVARRVMDLGATPALFVRILAGHVYVGALIGRNGYAHWKPMTFLLPVALAGTALLVYSFLRAGLERKLFLLFCFSLFAASLWHPLASRPTAVWQLFLDSRGMRYWFFPMLGFLWSLVWSASEPGRQRPVFSLVLLLLVRGAIFDWRQLEPPNLEFPSWARKFEAAPPGTLVEIPTLPEGWTLRLTKH
jgi:hypothetical protein